MADIKNTKEPIRVLEEIADLGSGGIETLLMNVYRYIDTSRLQMDFVVNYDRKAGLYEKEIADRGGRIFYLPEGWKQWPAFFKFLKRHPEYKIIHSHRGSFGAFYLLIASLTGIKHRIVHAHLANERTLFRRTFVRIMRPFLAIVSTKRFGCGYEAGKWIFGNFKFEIFRNAIDIASFRCFDKRETVRRTLNIPDDCILFGHVGRFNAQKNHNYLLDIFFEIQKIENNSKLLLVGSGELYDDIFCKIKTLNLIDKVIVLKNRKDVNELLQAIDLIIFPSLYEGFSFAQVEMQAAGLRILSTDKVDKSINITGEVYFKPLEDGPCSWAEEALRLAKYDKCSIDISNLYRGGFDIKENALRLQNYYLSLQ